MMSVEVRAEQTVDWLRKRAGLTTHVLEVYTRDAGRNAVIAAVQAEHGRNPFFSTPREQRAVAETLAEAMSAYLRAGNERAFEAIARRAADDLARNAQAHVYQRKTGEGVSSGGQTAPLKPSTIAAKKRAVAKGQARAVLPELIATGKFVASFAGRVRRG